MTAGELAEELEVSVRTIHRDVEALSEAGVPIYAERGPHGGIRLVDGYRTRLTGMTADEAEALFLSGLPGPAAELGPRDGRDRGPAQGPRRAAARAADPGRRGSSSASTSTRRGWFQAGEPVPHLGGPVGGGLGDPPGRDRLRARRPDASQRTIEPLGLVLKAGVWYVVAVGRGRVPDVPGRPGRRCDRARRAVRPTRRLRPRRVLGRVERRVRARRAADRGHRPDPGRAASTAFGSGVGHGPSTGRRLPADDPDGWRHLRLRLDWPEEVPAASPGRGPDLEVLAPAEVREQMLANARATLQRYAVAGAGAAGEPANGGQPPRRLGSSRTAWPIRTGASAGGGTNVASSSSARWPPGRRARGARGPARAPGRRG